MKAEYNIKGERVVGKVIKENKYTIWVVAPDGRVVKRHRVKHNVLIK